MWEVGGPEAEAQSAACVMRPDARVVGGLETEMVVEAAAMCMCMVRAAEVASAWSVQMTVRVGGGRWVCGR